LIWPYKNNECIQQVVLELKLRYGRLEKIIEKGLEQTWQYMDKCGTNEGYLLILMEKVPGKSIFGKNR